MKKQEEDLTVAGPRSPISLEKTIKHLVKQGRDLGKDMTVFISDIPIAKDDSSSLYITPDACKEQALWFLNNVFDGFRIPYYIIHHILFLYEEGNEGYKEYSDSESIKMKVVTKELKATSPEYIFVLNKLKYGKDDPEFLQILGFLQLLIGSIKQGNVRLYIEHPETHLHPKRERGIMMTLHNIKNEYAKL